MSTMMAGDAPLLGEEMTGAVAPTEQRAETVGLNEFWAHMPDHRYIFMPTRDLWPATSVDARVGWPDGPDGKPMRPSRWLDENRPIEQMTWAPGEPQIIDGRLLADGGWIDHAAVTVFNQYRPPTLTHGDPTKAEPWLDHVRHIYPDDAAHLIKWLAHRVQRPGEKINHAIVLGGKQGIGKDTIIEPVKHAVGPWNCSEVSPGALLGRFNGFAKSVILRISEARDLGDQDRFSFYDHTKLFTAAPPDVIRVDEKHLREYPVLNVCGVIITTNHKTNGLYLPEDDRRHYVAWSALDKETFEAEYWQTIYAWYYEQSGIEHVAAYLAGIDLAGFDPKAPPPKTEAFWHIVNAARSPEESELSDVLDSLGNPDAVSLSQLTSRARTVSSEFADWLLDRKNRRQIPHRMEGAGYEPVRNDCAKDQLWKIGAKRQVVYGRAELSIRDRVSAAQGLSQ